MNKTSPAFRGLLVGSTIFAAVFLGFLICIKAIVENDAKKIPPQWEAGLDKLTLAQIHKKLGPPQDDVCEKEFQNWVENDWWGAKILTVSSDDNCKPNSKPGEIYYIAIVRGNYFRLYKKMLFTLSAAEYEQRKVEVAARKNS